MVRVTVDHQYSMIRKPAGSFAVGKAKGLSV